MPISVFLADDDTLFRDGLAHLLENDGRFAIAGKASSGEEAITGALSLRPDLVLIDLRMPGMSGVEAIRRIRAANSSVPIGVLTIFERPEYVQSALDAGANGYVAKDATPSDLAQAAIALVRGERHLVVPPLAEDVPRSRTRESPVLGQLTEREIEVLRALCTRGSNEAIARGLGISQKTLRNHVSNIYQKLNIHDRAQAVRVAVQEALVPIDWR